MSEKRGKANTLIRVTELAMALGRKHLADYGAVRSRKDFTQRQLMACLILRAYLKTTYRGLVEILETSQKLRETLGMEEKLPHYSTLAKFSARRSVQAVAEAMITRLGIAARKARPEEAAAIDATGMETSAASVYYRTRSGKENRRWVKVSAVVLCGLVMPLGVHFDWGPSHDMVQAHDVLEPVALNNAPPKLLGDAGHDAEWLHVACREHWGIQSVFKPARCARDGSRSGKYRAMMSPEYLQEEGYGRRWHIESFWSGLKRTTGSALAARNPASLLAEAAIRVLAYALRR
jgi:hypothetical protein